MSGLSKDDLVVVQGDARLSCRTIMQALGMARIENLHRMIERNRTELESYDEILDQGGAKVGKEVFRHDGEKPQKAGEEVLHHHGGKTRKAGEEVFSHDGEKPQGGRPERIYYLTEEHALLICMFSRTPQAASVRKQVITVFQACRNGCLASTEPQRDVFETAAARARQTADHLQSLGNMEDFAFRVSHMPLWANGRRPAWWFDLEVRSFLIVTHRQMSTLQAAAGRS